MPPRRGQHGWIDDRRPTTDDRLRASTPQTSANSSCHPSYSTPISNKHYQEAVVEHMKRNSMMPEMSGIVELNTTVNEPTSPLPLSTSQKVRPSTGGDNMRGSGRKPELDTMNSIVGWIDENTELTPASDLTPALDKNEEVEVNDEAEVEAERMEVLFIRRMRMGGLKASINTTGFSIGLNFKNLLAEVDPYTIHGEALAWRDLAYRLISHMGWSVARHATTSRINKLFGNWGSSSTNSTTTTSNSLVLTNTTQPSGSGLAPQSAHSNDTGISPLQQGHDSRLLNIPFTSKSRQPDALVENTGTLNEIPSGSRRSSEMRHSNNLEKLLGRRPK